jgi:hypothetical protein
MRRFVGFLTRLVRGFRTSRGIAKLARPARWNRPRLEVETLEDRIALNAALQLPDGGGSYQVGFDNTGFYVLNSDNSFVFRPQDPNFNNLTILGSAQPDTIQIDFRTNLPAGVTFNLAVVGVAGDSATVYCPSGANTVNLNPAGTSTVVGPGYILAITGCPHTFVNGGATEIGSATLTDPSGTNLDVQTTAYAYIQNTQLGIFQVAAGFNNTSVVANQSGTDTAWLYDSPDFDIGVMTGSYAYIHGQLHGYTATAYGFASYTEVADDGGSDTLWVYGSPGNEKLYYNLDSGSLQRANQVNSWFSGFQEHYFVGNGGTDTAYVTADPGSNTFVGGGSTAHLTSLNAEYDMYLCSFQNVNVTGSPTAFNLSTVSTHSYALSLTNFTSSTKFLSLQPQTRAQSLADLKQLLVLIDPTLATTTDPMTLAIRLRNDIHQEVPIGSNSIKWQGAGAYGRFLLTVVLQQEPVICGGWQILYTDMCQAFGLQARYVDLWASDNFNNHASVEVQINGKWIAMDPTYNVSFIGTDGSHLSFADIQAGVPFTITRDGYTSRPAALIENYPVTLQQFCTTITYPPTVTN